MILLYPVRPAQCFILPNDVAPEADFEAGCVLAGSVWIEHCRSDPVFSTITLPDDRRFHIV